MGTREVWDGSGFVYPADVHRIAALREAQGFDGRNFGDAQNRYGDPYVAMGTAAQVTRTLQMGTGVTNPVTRHPAVTAGAIGSVQVASGGRAALGLARGDSALAHIGMSPAPLTAFEAYLRALQGYLAGEEVPFALADAAMGGRRADLRASTELHAGRMPTSSRMQWLPGDVPKVPVDVYATGPRVIRIGARTADRVTFAVGGDPDRVRWAVGVARRAREEAGLDPDGVSYGAMVAVGIDDDLDRARRRIAGVVATTTRFSFLHDNPVGPVDDADLEVFRRVRDSYDMLRHSVTTSDQASVIPDGFMDRHAIVGPGAVCVERMQELYAAGVDRLVLLFHGMDPEDQSEVDEAYARFAAEVIPAIRAA